MKGVLGFRDRTGRFMMKPVGLVSNRPVRYQTGQFRHKPAGRFGLLAGLNQLAIKPIKPVGSGSDSPVFKTLSTIEAEYVATCATSREAVGFGSCCLGYLVLDWRRLAFGVTTKVA
jgi:hypothetical protein